MWYGVLDAHSLAPPLAYTRARHPLSCFPYFLASCARTKRSMLLWWSLAVEYRLLPPAVLTTPLSLSLYTPYTPLVAWTERGTSLLAGQRGCVLSGEARGSKNPVTTFAWPLVPRHSRRALLATSLLFWPDVSSKPTGNPFSIVSIPPATLFHSLPPFGNSFFLHCWPRGK